MSFMYLLSLSLVLWLTEMLLVVLVSGYAFPSQTSYFHAEFGGPVTYGILGLMYAGLVLSTEKIYFRSTINANRRQAITFDEDHLLKNTILIYFRQDVVGFLSIPLGLIFAPASAFKSAIRLVPHCFPHSRRRLKAMADLVLHLRDWRDGMSMELFSRIYTKGIHRSALHALKSYAIVSVSPEPPHDLLVNQQILSRWAANSIFIPPIPHVCQAITTNFITLNNSKFAQYWKIVWELYLTFALRFTFGLIASCFLLVIPFLLLPAHDVKWMTYVSLSILIGLIYTATPEPILKIR